MNINLNPIQDTGEQKGPPLSKKSPTTPQKMWFFWSNPYKIEVMATSLTEMLELPDFGHMTTFTL